MLGLTATEIVIYLAALVKSLVEGGLPGSRG